MTLPITGNYDLAILLLRTSHLSLGIEMNTSLAQPSKEDNWRKNAPASNNPTENEQCRWYCSIICSSTVA